MSETSDSIITSLVILSRMADPPFDITAQALQSLTVLGRLVGRLEGLPGAGPKLAH